MKEDANRKQSSLEAKVRQFETEKAELSAKEQAMRESYQQLQKDKEANERSLNERLDEEKKSSQRMVEEYKLKMHQSEESQKEMQRHVMSSESEFDKQKALLD